MGRDYDETSKNLKRLREGNALESEVIERDAL
jgi:hypothetical protein